MAWAPVRRSVLNAVAACALAGLATPAVIHAQETRPVPPFSKAPPGAPAPSEENFSAPEFSVPGDDPGRQGPFVGLPGQATLVRRLVDDLADQYTERTVPDDQLAAWTHPVLEEVAHILRALERSGAVAAWDTDLREAWRTLESAETAVFWDPQMTEDALRRLSVLLGFLADRAQQAERPAPPALDAPEAGRPDATSPAAE